MKTEDGGQKTKEGRQRKEDGKRRSVLHPASPVFRSPSFVGGFTLIELIVATAISALVIGIVSVCFSFVLRVWQNTQNRKPDQTFQLAKLLQRQLAECDPTPINFENGPRPLFAGQPNSLVFVTAHSVKAISHGVPVVARYTYDPSSKVLSYSELVLDPHHPASIEQFASGRPSPDNQTEIRSYGIDFPKFTLSYAGKDSQGFSQSWKPGDTLPVEVLLSWEGKDSAVHAMVCMVNSPFPIQAGLLTHPTVPGGLK